MEEVLLHIKILPHSNKLLGELKRKRKKIRKSEERTTNRRNKYLKENQIHLQIVK